MRGNDLVVAGSNGLIPKWQRPKDVSAVEVDGFLYLLTALDHKDFKSTDFFSISPFFKALISSYLQYAQIQD